VRQNKYIIGDKNGCLEVIGVCESKISPNGIKKRILKVLCHKCKKEKEMATQVIGTG
jgi:hypothetical protein